MQTNEILETINYTVLGLLSPGITINEVRNEIIISKIKPELPEEIKALVEERKQARAEKNWAKSDEIRDRIISLGYSIKDTKDGIIVKKEN